MGQMNKYGEISEFDKTNESRTPSFDRWKTRWVIAAGYNKYLYNRKIYTWDKLVALYKELYGL
jgi:hypothetical protein